MEKTLLLLMSIFVFTSCLTAMDVAVTTKDEIVTALIEKSADIDPKDVTNAVISGNEILTMHKGGIARIWDAQTGEFKHELVPYSPGVTSAQFSSDGKWITTTVDGETRTWNTETGELRFITVSHDETARLWDPETGKVITE